MAFYRLLTLKQAVSLEGLGMRPLGRRSATALAKRELGLGRNTPRERVLEMVELAIEEARAALQPGDIC